ncbi:MAG: cohesin domain-containing protein [Candidatus Sumerlaeia bacterium]
MNTRSLCAILLLFVLAVGSLHAASSISVDSVEGAVGGEVLVPVSIDSDQSLAGINVRLEYDSSILEAPSAVRGSLLQSDHALEYYSPEAGKLNIVAYGSSTVAPFASTSGVIFNLVFNVKEGAAIGSVADIAFAAEITGTPSVPGSGLSDATGVSISHPITEGSVTVSDTAIAPNQLVYISAPGPFSAGAWDYTRSGWSGFLEGSGTSPLAYALSPEQWLCICVYDVSLGVWTDGMFQVQNIWNPLSGPQTVSAAPAAGAETATDDPQPAGSEARFTDAQEYYVESPGNFEVAAWNYTQEAIGSQTTGVDSATLSYDSPYDEWVCIYVYNTDQGVYHQGFFGVHQSWYSNE